MAIATVKNTQGGLSLVDPENILDNQFAELTNWLYNKEKRLQTRYGFRQYFSDVPDTVLTLNDCESTMAWSVSNDANGLSSGSAIRGSGSVKFNIDVDNSGYNNALIQNGSLSADITNVKNYLTFWINVPADFNTDLINVKLRLGTDSNNFYEWELPTLTEDASNMVKFNFADAVTTGTVVDTNIKYVQLRINYEAGYTDKSNIRIDDFQCYSSTINKAVTSYFFHQRDDNFERSALCVAGTNMFLWNTAAESWERIDSDLTEFEPLEPTKRTRWSFAVYKNVFYMCNGVDNYRSWNGTTIAEYPDEPKVRYLQYMGDRVFGAGDDENPITLYYINALAANAAVISQNSVVIGGDELGRINALRELGKFILAFKTRKIYVVSVAGNGSAEPIDSQNGGHSHRAVASVGNALLYQNDQGIDNLKQKGAATGAEALQSEPYTQDLRKLVDRIVANQRNASCGIFIEELSNYYFSFDTGNDNKPDSTLVYSALVGKAWTQYNYPSFYDYGSWIDDDGNTVYVGSSAQSGTIFRIENGFSDNGAVINHRLATKKYYFDDPSSWKDFHSVDIFGFMNLGGKADIEVYVDDDLVYTDTLDSTNITSTSGSSTIASDPIAAQPLGGGGESDEDVELFPYRIRLGGEIMGAGRAIQVVIYNQSNIATIMTLDRMRFRYDLNTEDIFF